MSGWAFAIAFLLAFVIGLRSSIRITSTYRSIRTVLAGPEELIAFAFVVVAWTVTLAAGWYGVVGVMRVADFNIPAESAIVSLLVAVFVLALPPFLDYVLEYIARTVGRRQLDEPPDREARP